MAGETQGSIDELQIEIVASSEEAVESIKNLVTALKNLQAQVNQKYNNPVKDIGRGGGTSGGTSGGKPQGGTQPKTQEPIVEPQVTGEVEEVESRVSRLKALWDGIRGKVRLNIDSGDVDTATKKVNKLSKLLKDVGRIVKYRAIRAALKAVTDGFKTGIENLYQFSKATGSEFAASMDKISTSSLYLKNSLGAMVAPILNALAPAIDWLVDRFVALLNVINQLFSVLSGSGVWYKAIKYPTEYAEAASGAAAAAKDWTLGIDELNVISDQSGGGGSSAADYSSMFEQVDIDSGKMEGILTLVELIGAALLAWKLSDSFTGGLKMALGLFLAINGAIELVRAICDAWVNGLDWENFWKMIIRGGEMVAGLAIAFGTVGAGIGLVVTGLALLVTGFHDAIENGWDLQNTLAVVAGMFATGIGIALLIGSWIPALVGAIAGIVVAITVATGHGEELIGGVKSVLKGFKDFFVGIFTGDITRAVQGVGDIFDGLKGIVNAVVNGLKDLIVSFLDWLDEKTNGKLTGIIGVIKGIVGGVFEWIDNTFTAEIEGLKQVFQGVVEFISGVFTADWDLAWQGIKDIFAGIWNGIVGVLESAVNIIIKGINFVIEKINTISFDVPDWVPGIGGDTVGFNLKKVSEWKAPKLASGGYVDQGQMFIAREAGPELVGTIGSKTAVANNEQITRGIYQAVLQAMQEANASQSQQTVQVESKVYLDGKQLTSSVEKHQRQRGANIMAGGVRG